MVGYRIAWRSAAQHGVTQYGEGALCWHGALWCSVASCGMAWRGKARFAFMQRRMCAAQDMCILPRTQRPPPLPRYTGPPELFTCFTCLWGSPQFLRQLNKFPVGWVAENVALLRQLRHKYELAHGQCPHPITLMTKALLHMRQL